MSGDLPAAPGAARTALLGPRGSLIAAATATVTNEAILLDCERVREEALAAALDRYRITDDVEISLAERGDFEIVCTDAAPTPKKPDSNSPGWVLETGVGFVRRDFRPWPARTIVHVGLRAGGRISFQDLIEGGGESAEASPEEQSTSASSRASRVGAPSLTSGPCPSRAGCPRTSASARAATSARSTWRGRRIGAGSPVSCAGSSSTRSSFPKLHRSSSFRLVPRAGSRARRAARTAGVVRPRSRWRSSPPTCRQAPPSGSFAARPPAWSKSERAEVRARRGPPASGLPRTAWNAGFRPAPRMYSRGRRRDEPSR